jgi:hypothetical protein
MCIVRLSKKLPDGSQSRHPRQARASGKLRARPFFALQISSPKASPVTHGRIDPPFRQTVSR